MTRPSPDRRSEPTEADQRALQGAKRLLRAAVRERRASRPEELRARDDAARSTLIKGLVGDHAGQGWTVASYLSVDPEPSTLDLVAWFASRGATVLLPVLQGRGGRPDWARYGGPDQLRAGLWGIPEPTTPSLGAAALGEAALVLCSGLAATAHGERLGVGGGWFDRALGHARPDTVTVVLLNDDEVLATLPAQEWDVPIDVIATPQELITRSG